jgi:hypothetical protein
MYDWLAGAEDDEEGQRLKYSRPRHVMDSAVGKV